MTILSKLKEKKEDYCLKTLLEKLFNEDLKHKDVKYHLSENNRLLTILNKKTGKFIDNFDTKDLETCYQLEDYVFMKCHCY